MASHGISRVQHSPRTPEARQKEYIEIEKYQNLSTKTLEAAAENIKNQDTFGLTTQLLKLNPEYYTIWNYRRRILQHFIQTLEEASFANRDVEELLNNDLKFLLPLLIRFPKCYWTWNHRLWLLHQHTQYLAPDKTRSAWRLELELVDKMLGRDGRNFHGWSYRRMIIDEMRNTKTDNNLSISESEYAYTTKMVNTNLSNFSAWHYRSKLIPRLLDERSASPQTRRQMFEDELAFVKNALYIDPYDQSLWFYHQFLISVLLTTSEPQQLVQYVPFAHFTDADRRNYLRLEIEQMRGLLDDTDDCKWIYQYLLQYSADYRRLSGDETITKQSDMCVWLERLMTLDQTRSGRWNSLQDALKLSP